MCNISMTFPNLFVQVYFQIIIWVMIIQIKQASNDKRREWQFVYEEEEWRSENSSVGEINLYAPIYILQKRAF